MLEDQNISPLPGPTDGEEQQQGPTNAQKRAGAKKQNNDSLPNPKNTTRSSKYTTINMGNSGPVATGDNATANIYQGPVFQGTVYQGRDSSLVEQFADMEAH